MAIKFKEWCPEEQKMYQIPKGKIGSDEGVYLQYSEQKDADGKEIYDGDIIALTKVGVCTFVGKDEWAEVFDIFPRVVGVNGGGSILYESLDKYLQSKKRPSSFAHSDHLIHYTPVVGPGKTYKKDSPSNRREYVEVLGNIYENEELLKNEYTQIRKEIDGPYGGLENY